MHPILKHRPSQKLWYGLLGVGVAIGVIGTLNVLINGHAHVYNVTREIPWGVLISTYEYFIIISTGLFLVASLGHVFGIEKFAFIGKRALLLAILALFCGFGAIGMEISHPVRMGIYALLSPNLASPIWWMGPLYGSYLLLLCGAFYFLLKNKRKQAFALGIAGFVVAIATAANVGAVLGLLEARPYWHGSFLPVYFVLSAWVSGGAIVSLIVYFNHKKRGTPMPQRYEEFMATLGKLQALFLTILIFFVIWKIIPGLYGHPPEKFEATMASLTGPLAFNFWFFEVLLGMLIPVVILLNPRTRTPGGVMWAGLLSTCGIFFMRYDLVVAGQLFSMREGAADLTDGLLHYSPSITELAIVVGAISLCLFLYSLAERFLPLQADEH